MRSKACTICPSKVKVIALLIAVYKLIFTLVVMILSINGIVLYGDKPDDYTEGKATKLGITILLINIASICGVLLGLHLMLFCAVIKVWISIIKCWSCIMLVLEIPMIICICVLYDFGAFSTVLIHLIWTAINLVLAFHAFPEENNLGVRSTPLLETKEECDEEKDEDDSSSVKLSSV